MRGHVLHRGMDCQEDGPGWGRFGAKSVALIVAWGILMQSLEREWCQMGLRGAGCRHLEECGYIPGVGDTGGGKRGPKQECSSVFRDQETAGMARDGHGASQKYWSSWEACRFSYSCSTVTSGCDLVKLVPFVQVDSCGLVPPQPSSFQRVPLSFTLH